LQNFIVISPFFSFIGNHHYRRPLNSTVQSEKIIIIFGLEQESRALLVINILISEKEYLYMSM
jgi:hypothetical protein